MPSKVASVKKADLTMIVSKFTQELGVYKSAEAIDRLQEWENSSTLTPL